MESKEDAKSPSESVRLKRENPHLSLPESKEDEKSPPESGLKRNNPHPSLPESKVQKVHGDQSDEDSFSEEYEEEPMEYIYKERDYCPGEDEAVYQALKLQIEMELEEEAADVAEKERAEQFAAAAVPVVVVVADDEKTSKPGSTGLPALDIKKESQHMILSGEPYDSVLDVLSKRFRYMAEELVEENPRLVELARQLLELIEKPDTDTDKNLLDKTASELMGNEMVLDAMVENAVVDRRFADVASCLNHVLYLKEKEVPGTENVVRLRDDSVFDKVVKNQDTDVNVLCGALSIVFGYWFDEPFCDDKLTKHTIGLNWGLSASFNILDGDEEFDEGGLIISQVRSLREERRQEQRERKANH